MRRAKVRFRPEALADLDRAYLAVLELSQSLGTARDYFHRLEERCEEIGDLPKGGTPRDDLGPGLRIVHFEKSATIAYHLVGAEVEVINVFYSGENYESVLRGDRERHEP